MGLIGTSPPMQRMREMIKRVALSDRPRFSLVESQFFGNERGTAVGSGTLYHGEIAELPGDLQGQTPARDRDPARTVPSARPTTVEFHGRIVAVIHADLEACVAKGQFSVAPVRLVGGHVRGEEMVRLDP